MANRSMPGDVIRLVSKLVKRKALELGLPCLPYSMAMARSSKHGATMADPSSTTELLLYNPNRATETAVVVTGNDDDPEGLIVDELGRRWFQISSSRPRPRKTLTLSLTLIAQQNWQL